jgi:pyruvate formate lyase activating enzyme
MTITLYTAPDCLRCKIVKAFLAEKNLPYTAVDYKEHKDEFNGFYRANRPVIYRNPEGIEFPLFHDGDVVRQGSGEIIAYLLSGRALEGSVTRSDLLHGWISGLYPSLCPAGQEDNYAELVRHLASGGLKVHLQPDGRRPDLLQRLLEAGVISRLTLNVLGPAAVYAASFGGVVSNTDLARTVELVKSFPKGEMRLLVSPVKRADGSVTWLTKEEAGEAAKMVAQATGQPGQPFAVAAVTELMPQGLQGLEPFEQFLPYRFAVRNHLFKADITKD